MKSSRLLVLTLALVLCASCAFAMFPGPNGKGYPNPLGDGTTQIQLYHGWTQGADAWYHCFSTNNVRIAQTEGLTLAPMLSSAVLPSGSSTMHVITNFNNFGPVFTGSPLNGVYSGVWEVFYVTWRPGVTPWVVKDALAPAGAFPGLPTAGVQADYSLTPPGQPAGTPVIVDCSIFAVGQISNPWRKPTSQTAPLIYRIPQGISVNTYTKELTIPYWNVYCQDPVTRRITTEKVVIPDAHPADLAGLIGANLAPVLTGYPDSDKQLFNVINWAQDIDAAVTGIQPMSVLYNQYPVICACPSECSWRNRNYDYSPVTQFALLNRVAPFPPSVLFKTCPFITMQVNQGNLLSVLYPTLPLPVPPTPVGYPPAGIATLYVLHSPVICDELQ